MKVETRPMSRIVPRDRQGLLSSASFCCWNGLWLLLFFIGTGIYMVVTPEVLDAYWFFQPLERWMHSHGILILDNGLDVIRNGIPWDGLKDSLNYRWCFDNARLGNSVVTLMLLFPKWIGSSIAVLCLMVAVLLSLQLSSINIKKSWLVSACLFMWTFCLPWSDSISDMVYQYNYIVPSAMAIGLIRMLFHKQASGLCAVFILSFLTGWWHEGFSIPLLTGAIAVMCIFKDCRNKKFRVASAGLVLGLLIIFLAPSFLFRIILVHTDSQISIIERVIKTFMLNVPLIVYLLILSVNGGVKGLSADKNGPLKVFLLVAGLTSAGLMFGNYQNPRVAWFSQVVSITGLLLMFNQRWSKRTRGRMILSYVCVIAVIIHLGSVDYYVIKEKGIYTKMLELQKNGVTMPIFDEVLTSREISPLALNLPDRLLFSSHLLTLNNKLGNPDAPLGIVPQELRHVMSTDGQLLDGNLEARLYKDRIVMPGDKTGLPSLFIEEGEADYGYGYRPVNIFGLRFRSEKDGRDYIYVYVYNNWLLQHMLDIKGIRMQPDKTEI